MKVGVYLCRCGGVISDRLDLAAVRTALGEAAEVAWVEEVDLACGDEGKAAIAASLRERRPDRAVVAACSPREHERTFRDVAGQAGLNPFLVQLVNVREGAAWVTPDRGEATAKAAGLVRGAVERVKRHLPLEVERIEVNPDVLVIGGGPAGLKAALTVAAAGRRAVLVEKDAILGGLPMRYEEIFPRMECGPCVMEPFVGDALHGPLAERIEVLLQSEVVELKGSFGNFTATVRSKPRHVNLKACIGCAECIPACPVSYPSPAQAGLSERKAIDFVFFGGLPNAPYVDPDRCTRLAGHPSTSARPASQGGAYAQDERGCKACLDACTIPGAIDLDATAATVERQVGAVVVAVGGALYDAGRIPGLGYGKVPGVLTSLEMERLLSANGPTGGVPTLPGRKAPESVGIVHCVGSLDAAHVDYCSGVCCMGAFKLDRMVTEKLEGAKVTHYYKTLAVAGKAEGALFSKVASSGRTELVRFGNVRQLSVNVAPSGRAHVTFPGGTREHDLLVLMPAMVAGEGVRKLAKVLDTPTDQHGFLEELHGRVDATLSKVRGVFLAGNCHAPMDLGRAMSEGVAAAGAALSALVPGRKLELEVLHAEVDEGACAACYACVSVCPYKAITAAGGAKARVNPALCVGCGTCVATCPSGAMKGRHFEDAQLMAEIEGVLA